MTEALASLPLVIEERRPMGEHRRGDSDARLSASGRAGFRGL
jgi:hypothetical protein